MYDLELNVERKKTIVDTGTRYFNQLLQIPLFNMVDYFSIAMFKYRF